MVIYYVVYYMKYVRYYIVIYIYIHSKLYMIGTSPNFHSFFTAPKVSSKIQIPSRAAVDAAVENGLCPKNQPANFGFFNPSNPRVPKNQTPKQIRSNSKIKIN